MAVTATGMNFPFSLLNKAANPPSIGRRHPADPGAAGFLQDDDAADIRDVEGRFHDLGAGGDGFLDAGIDIIDSDVRHPALGHACIIRSADVENAADRFAAHLGDPIGAAAWHRHRLEAPAQRVGIEFLGLGDVARHQLVPVKLAMRASHCELLTCKTCKLTCELCFMSPSIWRANGGWLGRESLAVACNRTANAACGRSNAAIHATNFSSLSRAPVQPL